MNLMRDPNVKVRVDRARPLSWSLRHEGKALNPPQAHADIIGAVVFKLDGANGRLGGVGFGRLLVSARSSPRLTTGHADAWVGRPRRGLLGTIYESGHTLLHCELELRLLLGTRCH